LFRLFVVGGTAVQHRQSVGHGFGEGDGIADVLEVYVHQARPVEQPVGMDGADEDAGVAQCVDERVDLALEDGNFAGVEAAAW